MLVCWDISFHETFIIWHFPPTLCSWRLFPVNRNCHQFKQRLLWGLEIWPRSHWKDINTTWQHHLHWGNCLHQWGLQPVKKHFLRPKQGFLSVWVDFFFYSQPQITLTHCSANIPFINDIMKQRLNVFYEMFVRLCNSKTNAATEKKKKVQHF